MDENFISRANIMLNDSLLKTEELFRASDSRWFADFADHFLGMCRLVREAQVGLGLSAISYLEYTMLYANFSDRRYVADVLAYGNKRRLDKNQRLVGSCNLSFLFVHFDELWDSLLTLRKRYAGKVTAWEVKSFMMQALPDFFSYLTNIARFAVAECIDKSPLTEIEKNEEFMVNVGAYMTSTETVYSEKKNKDADALAVWFEERLKNEYVFGDYSGLDFSGRSFNSADFRYSFFRHSCLDNASLLDSELAGVSFRNARMKKCKLSGCSIHEADFSYAVLKNASLSCVQAERSPIGKTWRHVGALPVNFRFADLTGADFTGANLSGADFTGATLDGAVFTDTVLDGAVFDSSVCLGR
ncbi:MAG: pentapeptide repeat-containing protein [Clostridiales bacterium]|nr:pentapeptide repeat-containing protein [Clostridiales bacterium]